MWQALASLITNVIVAFWKEAQARRDVKTVERQALALEAAERALGAMRVKARRDADIERVRDHGGTITLPSPNPGPTSSPD